MPDFSHEHRYQGLVAGVDEVGRGPLAGPVVSAAVIFTSPDDCNPMIKDSKKLSHAHRERLYDHIMKHAHVGVGIANVEEIDAMNILQASLLSMTRALENLSLAPVAALIDGIHAPITQIPCETIIKGDSVSFSIAAASIIAKVTRDRMMQALHQEFPHYAWDSNAGYGTKAHKEGLAAHGITPHHRRSFKPVAELA